VALARAILRDASILLLDEATESVDSEAEQLIQEAIERFAGQKTMIIISHRLSSILRANRVVVLSEGRIIEMGHPSTLQRPGTRFHELFAAQILAKKISA
jgi:ABC-type multidrug transport system fused ATPase/permease subunit